MGVHSRRKMLKALATTAVSSSLAPAWVAAQYGKADLVVRGTFHTMNPAYSNVKAMAVRGDRILALGSQDQIRNLIDPMTRVVQADGMTVTPGFIDAHSHPVSVNEAISVNVDFRRISEVQAALAEQAAKTPPGQWVLAHMYDDTKFEERRALNRRDIDAVVAERPVMVRHRGGHTVVVNSRAFEIAGVTPSTPDPEGGRYYREDGELTGKVAEHARNIFQTVGSWPEVTRDTRRENVTLISKRMASAGLTSTTDASGGGQRMDGVS